MQLKERHDVVLILMCRDNTLRVLSLIINLALQVPLYKHIADLAERTHFSLPVPSFTLISGGNHAGNNLAIKVSTRLV